MNESKSYCWGVVGILAAAMLLASGCGDSEDGAPTALRSVRFLVAEPASAARTRTFSGMSQASQQSRLSFRIGGTIEELPIKVGDQLAKGQLIARLEASPFELETEQALANLAQAQATERNAAAIYERTKELYADNNASRTDLDAARANAESAKAQVRAAQKQVELARLNVSYTRLTAGVDCSVAAVEVEINENVSSGSTVATVNCGTSLEVALAIPESLIGGLSEGMSVQVRFDALPDERFTGVVSEVGVAASSGTTFPATVSIDGRHPELRAGLAAEVTFEYGNGDARQTYLLPLSAIVHEPTGTFVFLAQPGEHPDEALVARRQVELGELTEDGVEVLAGLAAGDRVITAGTTVVRDGMRVRTSDKPTTESQTSATAE